MIDEATRDEAGSPNIPQKILEKIGKSDVFVADVSTINAHDSDGRKCPNPNVVFELGYAVQILGWERIILLFNTEYGDFPADLPFDFDRHRASPFRLIETAKRTDRKKLEELLATAVTMVIDRDPKRPSELAGLSEEELRYARDVRMLEWVLGEIHLPTIDDHLQRLPHSFPYRVLHFFEGARGIVAGNSLFHLNDKRLGKALRKFVKAWEETIRHEDLYHPNVGNTLVIFTNPGDMPLPPAKEIVWKQIAKARDEMYRQLTYILKRIRKDYPAIDLMDTNKRAWQDYRQHQSDS